MWGTVRSRCRPPVRRAAGLIDRAGHQRHPQAFRRGRGGPIRSHPPGEPGGGRRRDRPNSPHCKGFHERSHELPCPTCHGHVVSNHHVRHPTVLPTGRVPLGKEPDRIRWRCRPLPHRRPCLRPPPSPPSCAPMPPPPPVPDRHRRRRHTGRSSPHLPPPAVPPPGGPSLVRVSPMSRRTKPSGPPASRAGAASCRRLRSR